MRSAWLSDVRQTTSSRQSPNRSAARAGVDFVPLLATPLPVSSRVSPPVPYLSMCVPSRSSRTGSPSHQITKLIEPGLRPMFCPLVLYIPETPADHDSAPGLPAYTSSETPRPLSHPHDRFCQMICPVRASAIQAAGEVGPCAGMATVTTRLSAIDVRRSLTPAVLEGPLRSAPGLILRTR